MLRYNAPTNCFQLPLFNWEIEKRLEALGSPNNAIQTRFTDFFQKYFSKMFFIWIVDKSWCNTGRAVTLRFCPIRSCLFDSWLQVICTLGVYIICVACCQGRNASPACKSSERAAFQHSGELRTNTVSVPSSASGTRWIRFQGRHLSIFPPNYDVAMPRLCHGYATAIRRPFLC